MSGDVEVLGAGRDKEESVGVASGIEKLVSEAVTVRTMLGDHLGYGVSKCS